MRKSILLTCAAAGLALAGCDNAAEEADDTAADTTTMEAPAPAPAITVADGGPPEGTFQITDPDGTVHTETVNADGTFSWTSDEGEPGSGTWRIDDSGNWCVTVPDEEAEQCFAESVDANGVWNSVNVDDPSDSGVVVRMEM